METTTTRASYKQAQAETDRASMARKINSSNPTWRRARLSSVCRWCDLAIRPGDDIAFAIGIGNLHVDCVVAAVRSLPSEAA